VFVLPGLLFDWLSSEVILVSMPEALGCVVSNSIVAGAVLGNHPSSRCQILACSKICFSEMQNLGLKIFCFGGI